MTANGSGMNILIELGHETLDQLMGNVLALQLPLLRPEGYTRFDLIPRYMALAYWPEIPTIGGDTPDLMIHSLVRFVSESTDGTVFRYGYEEDELLSLFFQAIPEVRVDGVCMKLYYRGVGQFDAGVMNPVDLGPEIDLLRDELDRALLSLSFDIPFWGRPEPFHTPRLLAAHYTLPRGRRGALTLGIEVEGGSETWPRTFAGHNEDIGFERPQSLLDDVFDDGIETKMVIAVEGELMDGLARTVFEEEVLEHQASENIFYGRIEEMLYRRCWLKRAGHQDFNNRLYEVTCSGDLHLEDGPWPGVWDDATFYYELWFYGLNWDLLYGVLSHGDPGLVNYFNDWDMVLSAWFEEHFEISSKIGNLHFPLLPEVVQVDTCEWYCLSDSPQSSVTVYNASFAELGDPEINVIAEDPLTIDLATHHTKPGCKAFVTKEGNTEAWFTIQNTGDGPLKLKVTAEPAEDFSASVQSEILMPGETGARVALRSFASGTYEGVVRIHHNARNEEDISINVRATVINTYEDVNAVVSDDFRNVICSWADMVMFARGFPWWRSFFDELPIDTPYLEVFDLSLRDPDDDYRFVARTEAGELLASASPHTSFKWLHLPVDREATLTLEVQSRDQPGAKIQEPFFFTMRKQTVQMLSSFALEGSGAAAAFDGGLCVTSEAGLTVVDTLDPWRPLVTACLDEVGSLTAVAAFRRQVFAVGEKGLFLVDLSDFAEPKVMHMMEDLAGACAMKRYGRHLWVVRQNQINVFGITKEHTLELLAESQFEANALDFVVCRRAGVVLDKTGPLIFELQGTKLSLVGKQSVDNAGSVSLSTHGVLLCLTDAKTGTQMLDISQPKSPEAVAHYVQPFWRAGLVMDFSRNLAYKMSAKGNGFDIFLFHTNKVMRQ
jgi:hypothetical protein